MVLKVFVTGLKHMNNIISLQGPKLWVTDVLTSRAATHYRSTLILSAVCDEKEFLCLIFFLFYSLIGAAGVPNVLVLSRPLIESVGWRRENAEL